MEFVANGVLAAALLRPGEASSRRRGLACNLADGLVESQNPTKMFGWTVRSDSARASTVPIYTGGVYQVK